MIVGIISTGIRAGAVDISHRHKSLIRSFNRLQYFWTVQTFEEIFDRLNGLHMGSPHDLLGRAGVAVKPTALLVTFSSGAGRIDPRGWPR